MLNGSDEYSFSFASIFQVCARKDLSLHYAVRSVSYFKNKMLQKLSGPAASRRKLERGCFFWVGPQIMENVVDRTVE